MTEKTIGKAGKGHLLHPNQTERFEAFGSSSLLDDVNAKCDSFLGNEGIAGQSFDPQSRRKRSNEGGKSSMTS